MHTANQCRGARNAPGTTGNNAIEGRQSLPSGHCSSGVEQVIRNDQVVGSNPTSGSMRINELWEFPVALQAGRARPASSGWCGCDLTCASDRCSSPRSSRGERPRPGPASAWRRPQCRRQGAVGVDTRTGRGLTRSPVRFGAGAPRCLASSCRVRRRPVGRASARLCRVRR